MKVYTDGSSLGNTGPSGWAFVFVNKSNNLHYVGSGSYDKATNNKAEATAILEALAYAEKNDHFSNDDPLKIITDSKYCLNIIEKIHIHKKNNFFKYRGSDEKIPNGEVWEKVHPLIERNESGVVFEWVKGHSTNIWNNLADKTAVGESKKVMDERTGKASPVSLSSGREEEQEEEEEISQEESVLAPSSADIPVASEQAFSEDDLSSTPIPPDEDHWEGPEKPPEKNLDDVSPNVDDLRESDDYSNYQQEFFMSSVVHGMGQEKSKQSVENDSDSLEEHSDFVQKEASEERLYRYRLAIENFCYDDLIEYEVNGDKKTGLVRGVCEYGVIVEMEEFDPDYLFSNILVEFDKIKL